MERTSASVKKRTDTSWKKPAIFQIVRGQLLSDRPQTGARVRRRGQAPVFRPRLGRRRRGCSRLDSNAW